MCTQCTKRSVHAHFLATTGLVQIASQLDRRLYTLCTESNGPKLLKAGVLFRDRVYTETAALCDVGDVCYFIFFKRELATLIKQEARLDY